MRGYDLHNEKTDLFSAPGESACTEELPTAVLSAPRSLERALERSVSGTQGRVSERSCTRAEATSAVRPRHGTAEVPRYPFDFDSESDEATEALTQPLLQAARGLPSLPPSDDGTAELRALVQRAASHELRHRRPRRRS